MQASAQLSFLNCYICFETLKKPKMCPSCSKVACEKCLRSWVEQHRPECPHCRKTMLLTNFAQCERFISDIKHLLKAMDNSERTKQKCQEHKIQMTYYCQQCQEAICSDCGMFGMKHKEHKITHLSKIYQKFKNRILAQLTQYDQKIESYRLNGNQIKLEMQKLVMQIGQRKNFIEEYFVAIIERLEEEFKDKQEKIAEKYDSNTKQIEFLQSFRENIYRELESSSEKELITKCDELIGYIQSVFDKGPEFEPEQYKFDTIHEIVPKYHEFTYTLKGYDDLHEIIVYSDPYVNHSLQWRLKIYPKGNGQAKENFLSVFLEMSKGYANGNKYEYKIELINQKSPKDSVIREYSSNFDIGECWGYNQFIPLEELKEQFLTDSGDLVFKVSVRNPSYRSLVRDQHNYIQSLEDKLAKQQEIVSQPNIGQNPAYKPVGISRKSLTHLQPRNSSDLTNSNTSANNKISELANFSRMNREKMEKFLEGYSEDKHKILKEIEREHEKLQSHEFQGGEFLNQESKSDQDQHELEYNDKERETMLKMRLGLESLREKEEKVENPHSNSDDFDLSLQMSLERYQLIRDTKDDLAKKQKREKSEELRDHQSRGQKNKKELTDRQEKRVSNQKQKYPQYEKMGFSMLDPRVMGDYEEGFLEESNLSVSIDGRNGTKYTQARQKNSNDK